MFSFFWHVTLREAGLLTGFQYWGCQFLCFWFVPAQHLDLHSSDNLTVQSMNSRPCPASGRVELTNRHLLCPPIVRQGSRYPKGPPHCYSLITSLLLRTKCPLSSFECLFPDSSLVTPHNFQFHPNCKIKMSALIGWLVYDAHKNVREKAADRALSPFWLCRMWLRIKISIQNFLLTELVEEQPKARSGSYILNRPCSPPGGGRRVRGMMW